MRTRTRLITIATLGLAAAVIANLGLQFVVAFEPSLRKPTQYVWPLPDLDHVVSWNHDVTQPFSVCIGSSISSRSDFAQGELQAGADGLPTTGERALPGWCLLADKAIRRRLVAAKDQGHWVTVCDVAGGWPVPAFAWGSAGVSEHETLQPIESIEYGRFELDWTPQWAGLQSTTLAVMPIWPGFAINWAFYAAIIGALWYTPITLRAISRYRRGACAKCGYDRRGIPPAQPCPECGSPAASQLTPPTPDPHLPPTS